MSGQGIRLRQSSSPSACIKIGPLKATKSFGLFEVPGHSNGSPTRTPTSRRASPNVSPVKQTLEVSHSKTRQSPDFPNPSSPEKNNPISPSSKLDRGRARFLKLISPLATYFYLLCFFYFAEVFI